MRNTDLVYGQKYKLWRDGEFIGIATFKEDENVGDGFQRQVVSKSGELTNEVYIADEWEATNEEE